MEIIVTLNEQEINMLTEVLKTCQMYYEAIGDENNVEVGYCKHFQEKLDLQGLGDEETAEEEVTCNNEIWW